MAEQSVGKRTSFIHKVGVGCLLFTPVMASRAGKAQTPGLQAAAAEQGAHAEPAIPAILEAFKSFDVVAMPAAHGQKDTDDFILSLLRDPRLPLLVNDIVVECGNVRYQPLLDRYIAGEDIPFTEVQHVWRDTTVLQMCGTSGFYEQLFPLVRALNQGLPAAHRLRVVAADPPIDWNQIRSYQDLVPFFDRDGSIASVMEAQVLSKHRKALMLFGVFHLLHGGGPGQGDAVTRYERLYPGKTFVISDLGYYGTGSERSTESLLPTGDGPLLLRTKNTKLGSLKLDSFFTTPITTDGNCNAVDAFSGSSPKPVEDQVDAFLYLVPPGTQLAEPLPADIALDRIYRTEWLRRLKLIGFPVPSTLEELDAQTTSSAAHPLLPPLPRQAISQDVRSRMRQNCLAQKTPPSNTSR